MIPMSVKLVKVTLSYKIKSVGVLKPLKKSTDRGFVHSVKLKDVSSVLLAILQNVRNVLITLLY